MREQQNNLGLREQSLWHEAQEAKDKQVKKWFNMRQMSQGKKQTNKTAEKYKVAFDRKSMQAAKYT